MAQTQQARSWVCSLYRLRLPIQKSSAFSAVSCYHHLEIINRLWSRCLVCTGSHKLCSQAGVLEVISCWWERDYNPCPFIQTLPSQKAEPKQNSYLCRQKQNLSAFGGRVGMPPVIIGLITIIQAKIHCCQGEGHKKQKQPSTLRVGVFMDLKDSLLLKRQFSVTGL